MFLYSFNEGTIYSKVLSPNYRWAEIYGKRKQIKKWIDWTNHFAPRIPLLKSWFNTDIWSSKQQNSANSDFEFLRFDFTWILRSFITNRRWRNRNFDSLSRLYRCAAIRKQDFAIEGPVRAGDEASLLLSGPTLYCKVSYKNQIRNFLFNKIYH